MGENWRPCCTRLPLFLAYSRQRRSHSLSFPKMTQTATHFWQWLPHLNKLLIVIKGGQGDSPIRQEPLCILDIKKNLWSIQISLETTQGPCVHAAGWFIRQICTKPPQYVLNAFIMEVQSVWLCISLQRESARQLWPEVTVDSKSDK